MRSGVVHNGKRLSVLGSCTERVWQGDTQRRGRQRPGHGFPEKLLSLNFIHCFLYHWKMLKRVQCTSKQSILFKAC